MWPVRAVVTLFRGNQRLQASAQSWISYTSSSLNHYGSSCFSHNQHSASEQTTSRSDYFPPLKLKIEIILGPDSDRLPLPSVRSLLYWRLSSVVSSPCLLSLFSPRATWTTCSLWPLITQYFATTRELNTVTRDLLSMNHEPSQVVNREIPLCAECSKPKPGLRLHVSPPLYAASLHRDR